MAEVLAPKLVAIFVGKLDELLSLFLLLKTLCKLLVDRDGHIFSIVEEFAHLLAVRPTNDTCRHTLMQIQDLCVNSTEMENILRNGLFLSESKRPVYRSSRFAPAIVSRTVAQSGSR